MAEPIPHRLNLMLIGGVQTGTLALLWLGSHSNLVVTQLCGVLLSFLLLTNYALLHEATHDVLHPDRRGNDLLGALCGALFPVSFTMLKIGHQVHHRCNRTDHEMFDHYYPDDNLLLKYGQWYGLITGLYYPLVPLGSLLLAIAPGLFRTRAFARAKTTARLFNDFDTRAIARVRLEVLGTIALWALLFQALDLHWSSVLLMYACFGFNWSTRQYVTHAFTRRDVLNGALNLRVGRVMGWILLNGQWDLVHHQKP